MKLVKLMSVFLLFNVLVFAQTLTEKYPNLSQNDIEHYEKQIEHLSKIEELYHSFETLSQDEKTNLKKMLDDLVPKDMYQDLRNKDAQEFLILFAPLMNFQAYIIIDKFSDDNERFFKALIVARLLKNAFPTNIAYHDTYLWGEVKRGQFDVPLKEYPKLLEVSNNNPEIKEHYDYILKIVAFNPTKTIQQIQKIIQNQYYTITEYNQTKLFQELESITTQDKEEFIKNTNEILQKYVKNEIEIIDPKKQTSQKQSELSWKLQDNTLYIKPTITNESYQRLKEVLQNNRYEKIILDLRGNEGGTLNGVIDIVSVFLDDGENKILTIKEKFDTMTFTTRQNYSLDITTPLEVQIDDKTARGAMYIAAILQKNKRATISGNGTKIDNSILNVLPLRDIQDDMILIKFQIGYSLDEDGNELEILSAITK